MTITAHTYDSPDASDTSSRKIVVSRFILPRRLGVTVVFLGRGGCRWHLFRRYALLRCAPAVAVVGTNSEINVGETMSDSSIPT